MWRGRQWFQEITFIRQYVLSAIPNVIGFITGANTPTLFYG